MIAQNLIALVMVYILIILVFVVCNHYMKKRFEGNIRKIIHLSIGNFVFVWWLFTEWWIMIIFFVIPFALILLRTILRSDTTSVMGKATNEGSSTGLLFYVIAVGVLVTAFFGHFVAASVGIVAMTYGDSMGSIIGKRYGKHKLYNNKSLEGTVAVFIFTTIMAFVVIVFYSFLIANGLYSNSSANAIIPTWSVCIIAGTASALLEMTVPGNYDNIAVPIGVTSILCLLGM